MTQEKLIPLNEAAAEVGLGEHYFRVLCKRGRVEGARQFGRKGLGSIWMIPTPVKILSKVGNGFVTPCEAAAELGISAASVREMCKRGRVAGACKKGGVWAIPTPVRIGGAVAEGFATSQEAADIMGVSRKRVIQLCVKGGLEGAVKQGNRWAIPLPIKRIDSA